MKVLDIAEPEAKRLKLPSEAHVKLANALARVVEDGRQALAKNPDATKQTKLNLEYCNVCVGKRSLQSRVIDGDAWEESVNPDSKDCSVDFAVLVETESNQILLPVEAKLGMAFEYPGDRAGSSLTLKSLQSKYAGFLALVGPSAMAVSGKLMLLVPKDGQEWMWYKVRAWNRLDSSIGKILSCCMDDFCRVVGLEVGTSVNRCESDDMRYNRLRQEFLSPAKMSPIQLAPIADCMACGACRDACKKHAIAMIPNDEVDGELRPFIDTISCTKCGYCETVCHVLVRHKMRIDSDSVNIKN